METRKWKPTPSMVVASIALFVALGGGAFASVAINEVRSQNIKNGEVKAVDLANAAVTRAKLRNSAVNSAKVANGSLGVVDLSAAAQAALKGNTGPQGPAGATGAAGAAAGYVARFTNVLSFGTPSTDQTVATLNLPAGSFIINAKVVANNNDASDRNFGCALRLDTTVLDNLHDAELFPIAPNVAAGEREAIALTGGGTLAAAGTATVVCRTNATAGNWLARNITAVQVQTLTGP